jgi:hypothetical protein
MLNGVKFNNDKLILDFAEFLTNISKSYWFFSKMIIYNTLLIVSIYKTD